MPTSICSWFRAILSFLLTIHHIFADFGFLAITFEQSMVAPKFQRQMSSFFIAHLMIPLSQIQKKILLPLNLNLVWAMLLSTLFLKVLVLVLKYIFQQSTWNFQVQVPSTFKPWFSLLAPKKSTWIWWEKCQKNNSLEKLDSSLLYTHKYWVYWKHEHTWKKISGTWKILEST